jgi:flagellar hook assembly protein FlgD
VNVASPDATATATLEVFDQLGDKVVVIADAQKMDTNRNMTFSWNGFDQKGERPQPGGYFLKLQLVFPSGGELSKIYKVVYLEKIQ